MTGSLSYSLWLCPAETEPYEEPAPVRRLLGQFANEDRGREWCAFLTDEGALWVFFSDNGTVASGHAVLKRVWGEGLPACWRGPRVLTSC